MGLDMYLRLIPKKSNYTFKELIEIEDKAIVGEIDSIPSDIKESFHFFRWEEVMKEVIGWEERVPVGNLSNTPIDLPESFISDESCRCTMAKQLCYWRNADAIHLWFVDVVQEGVEDSSEYEVFKSDLEKLLGKIQLILSAPSEMVASKMLPLPITSGYCHAMAEYDSYYFKTLRLTEKHLSHLLEVVDFEENHIYYWSSLYF